MSINSALDEFIKRLEEKLTQLLDQNIGKDKYSIERRFYGGTFSYKGRDMRNEIVITRLLDHNINFLLDFFRIIWTDTSGGYKVVNGQWEDINYPTIFVKVAFGWTSENDNCYDAPNSQAKKLLDVLERYNWVEGNTNDEKVVNARETFEIKSPFGEVQTLITATRNRKYNMDLIRCFFSNRLK